MDKIKTKITGNVFPKEILNDYEFYITNNNFDLALEQKFFEELNPSFETKYLQGLILFRKNNFKKSFNILINLLDESPKRYNYYDLLVKTSRITKNESKIENQLDKIESPKYKNYLKAQLAYQKAEYNEAKDLFDEILKSDSTSFDPLFMQAYTYRNLGDYKTALKYFNKASNLLKKNDPLIAKVTIAIGSLFYLSGNYDKANELYQRGLKIASETFYNTEKVKAILNLGMIWDLQGIIDKARSNFDKASKLASEIGDKELEATSLTEYAVSYTYTDEKIKAREKYELSFLLFEELKNKNRFASTAINIGHSYLNIANYKSAIKYYNTGLNEAGENVRTKMLALQGLGDVYTNLSDYSKALDYYGRAKKIAEQMKDVPANAKINIGLGVLYYNLNMPQKALELLKKSERRLIESENPYLKLEIGQKIGIIYNSLDSLSLAQTYLIKSSDMAKKYGDVYSEILSNTFLSEILIKQDDIPAALSLLNKTIATTNSIGYNQLLGVQNLLMGDISGFKSNRESQMKYVEQAKYHADKSKDFNTLIKANQKLGEIFEQQNELDRAEEYYQAAINIIDLNFNRLFTKADIQIKFFSNYYSVYNSLISLYLVENKYKAAFEILEKSKARNTSQNLINHKLENSTKNNELLNKYYDIAWKLNSGLYNNDELTFLTNLFEDVKDSIVLINPSIEKYLIGNNQFSIVDIQHNFKSDEYVISYFVGTKDIYAFQLSANALKTKKINISIEKFNEFNKSISPYYDKLLGSNEISFNKDLFAFNADGAKLFYENIVKPIILDIPSNAKLIFSLPNEMLTIPFELLVTQSNDDSSPYLLDDKRFLIDDYIISYTPSISIWNELKNNKISNTQTALLIGNPFFENQNESVSQMRGLTDEIDLFSRNMNYQRLEYSEEEIESIGSLLSNNEIYLSKDATETVFKNNVENASIVHLSTHSFLYKDNPLILFSNTDEENDGYLEVGEILRLNLKSDLVVLSSCKSGLGRVDKAEGIIGMQKAFFDAGAKSVVVSLWDVNDKYTSIFMKYFYSFLSNGVSKSEALRSAKLKFIKQNNPNPYYWSAFTIAGNDSQITIQTKNNNFIVYFIVLFITLILISYMLYLQRQKKKMIIQSI